MINGKKSLFYTVLMAGALMSCGGPKQAPNEEVAKSGNPVFEVGTPIRRELFTGIPIGFTRLRVIYMRSKPSSIASLPRIW